MFVDLQEDADREQDALILLDLIATGIWEGTFSLTCLTAVCCIILL
jgi:hypothetical protein